MREGKVGVSVRRTGGVAIVVRAHTITMKSAITETATFT
jgi:hypothetical protein